MLVKDKTECGGSEKKIGMVSSIGGCAAACKGLSSMFTFGTNDYGNARCTNSNSKCQCLCETSASSDGTCEEVHHTGYRLYKYVTSDEDKGSVVTREIPNTDL